MRLPCLSLVEVLRAERPTCRTRECTSARGAEAWVWVRAEERLDVLREYVFDERAVWARQGAQNVCTKHAQQREDMH